MGNSGNRALAEQASLADREGEDDGSCEELGDREGDQAELQEGESAEEARDDQGDGGEEDE